MGSANLSRVKPNTGLELTLRSAYPREAFALQLTPLGYHFLLAQLKPKSLESFAGRRAPLQLERQAHSGFDESESLRGESPDLRPEVFLIHGHQLRHVRDRVFGQTH